MVGPNSWNFLKAKYAPKRTISKNYLEGACPRTPLAKGMASPCAPCRKAICKFRNLKKKFLPPLPNLGYDPVLRHHTSVSCNL